MEDQDQVERDGQGTVFEDTTLLDALRRKHQELSDSKEITVDLPGYDGFLAVEYRVLSVRTEIAAIGKRVGKQTKEMWEAQVLAGMDLLARACVQVFVSSDGTLENRKPLAEAFGPDAEPVRYDKRLGEFMGFTGTGTAREVILALFAENEPMIMEHVTMITRWMSDTTKGVDEAFLATS